MIRPLGKLICWLRGRHKWGRAYHFDWAGDDDPQEVWNKKCRRCGTVAEVKRRKPKDAEEA